MPRRLEFYQISFLSYHPFINQRQGGYYDARHVEGGMGTYQRSGAIHKATFRFSGGNRVRSDLRCHLRGRALGI